MSARWALLAACALLLGAAAARAQVFSPGDLSKAHESIDGIRDCTKCHIEGGGHSDAKCLECHTEIGRRLTAGTGYHNTLKSQKCAECHLEHRGRGRDIVEWSPSMKDFNHRLSGWALEGAHKKPDCKECHEPRRIDDDAVLALIKKKGRTSFLGVSTRCVSCHFDEHRDQVGNDCTKCHNSTEFKESPGFDHTSSSDTRFPLVGKHRAVKCAECHETLTADEEPAFPKRRADTYLKLKNIQFASCVACHDDFHRGAFGQNCVRCHTPNGWRIIKESAQDTGFHDKHAFKLRGEHTTVACKSCHGPFPGQAAKFKGLKFRRCTDCHTDAHVGQIAAEEGSVRCEKCHDVTGFVPVLFDLKLHDTTRFPLENSHRTVACNLCHKSNARILQKVPQKDRSDMARRGRRLLVSDAQMSMPDVVETKAGKATQADCDICHTDPHNGQFQRGVVPADPRAAAKTCAECHTPTAFAETKFKHNDSRFPLTGKHADVFCAGCHTPSPVKSKLRGAVMYRPVAQECASCHIDAHVGQLVSPAGATQDCATCHSTKSFKPATFDHNKQSVFPLAGRHRQVQCVRCHPSADVKGTKIARYKPVPATCVACHDDEHKGDFDKFDPTTAVSLAPPTTSVEARCDGCHTPAEWAPAKFAHERTGFDLTGKHVRIRCAECHGSDTKRPLPITCAGCHTDVHAQEFGLMCSACHSTERFTAPAFVVDSHRRTNFPLNGRHAALPCDECHVEKRERTFTRAAIDCASCHAKDARAASLVTVDHGRAPFAAGSCRDCHIPATFTPARFPQHEACFPIGRGVHAPVSCAECHAGLPGTRANGACSGVPVRCAECHEHRAEVEDPRHAEVIGYEFKSEKCAGCHRSPR